MCHVDDACPRCGRMKMTVQDYGNTYHCLRCGRIETNPPPWPNRDRRKGERRDTKTYAAAMAFKRAETEGDRFAAEDMRREREFRDTAPLDSD